MLYDAYNFLVLFTDACGVLKHFRFFTSDKAMV